MITIHRVRSQLHQCRELSGKQLEQLITSSSVHHLLYMDTKEGELAPLEDQELPAKMTQLLRDHAMLFEEPKSLPPNRNWDHHIPLLPGTKPVCIKPYRYTPAQKTEIETQVKEMLQSGLIRLSVSPFSSRVLLVKKKDGTWRFCVDSRHLNAITVKNKYPHPIIDELLDELHGASWFAKLDMRAGYHQFRLHEADEMKTAFQTHNGHFEFRVMPYGLCNAPATFQCAMNEILGPYLRQFVLVFIDDILIYSPTLADHMEHVSLVLNLQQQHGLKLKQSKCVFAQRQVSYLGHINSAQGVSPGDKITEVRDWPTPVNVKELRGFLRLAGYYRKFVKKFGLISKPLAELLKKNAIFIWNPLHTTAFLELKHKLISAPGLALPNFNKPFVLETDACDKGIGAVLMQDGHPISFLSRALCPEIKAWQHMRKNV